MQNSVRLTNFEIYDDGSLNLDYFIKLKSFLNEYKNLDVPLTISFNVGSNLDLESDWEDFYNKTSLLKTYSDKVAIQLSPLSIKNSENINFICQAFDNVCLNIDNSSLSKGESALLFLSKFPVILNFIVNENNVEDLFYYDRVTQNLLESSTSEIFYKIFQIDFHEHYNDRKTFLEKMIKGIHKVIESESSTRIIDHFLQKRTFILEKENSLILDNDGKIYHPTSEIPLGDFNQDEIEIDLDAFSKISNTYNSYCDNCNAYSFCKNGSYKTMSNEHSRRLFCSFMETIGELNNLFLRRDKDGKKVCNV